MKNNIVILLLTSFVIISCNKDAKISEQNNDSLLTGDSVVINPSQNPNTFTVDALNSEISKGKTLFTQNGNIIIDYDTQANIGMIKIDGEELKLNKLDFSENNYQIQGNDIIIVAEDGNFDEMMNDCNYGTFEKITIQYKNKQSTFSNVKVQDCPSY